MPSYDIGYNNSSTVNYYSEQPFLNIFKTGTTIGGNTTLGNRYDITQGAINRDSNGYPMNMSGKTGSVAAGQTFTEFDFKFYHELPTAPGTSYPYRSGRYVLLWDDADAANPFPHSGFSFSFAGNPGGGGDAVTFISRAANRIIFNVDTPIIGFRLYMTGLTGTAEGSGSYPINMRLVYGDVINTGDTRADASTTGTWEAALAAGRVTDPDWKSRFEMFHSMRMMDWMSIPTNGMTTWSQMPTPTSIFWTTPPAECQVAVLNELNQHGWFNMPPLASYDYMAQFADIVYNGNTDSDGRVWDGLNSNLLAYVEMGNEYWHGASYPAWYATCVTRGKAAFPSWTNSDDAQRSYCWMTAVQNGKIWKKAFGTDSNRVKVVLAGWAGSAAYNETQMPASATRAGGIISNFTGSISGNTMTVTVTNSGTVSIYQEITGTGIAPATYITTNNGDGTYVISGDAQNVSSTTITGRYWTGTVASNCDYYAVDNYWYDKHFAYDVTVDAIFDEVDGTSVVNGSFRPTVSGYISGTTLTVVTPASQLGTDGCCYPGQEITIGATSGTTIVSQLTTTQFGSRWGLRGTYQVSISQTVGSALSPVTFTLAGGLMRTSYAYGFVTYKTCQSNSYGNGIPLLAYEGGHQMQANRTSGTAAQLAQLAATYTSAMRDSRMETAYAEFYPAWATLTSSPLMMAFATVGEFGVGTHFGHLENILATSSPRYDAMLSLVSSPSVTHRSVEIHGPTYRNA